MNYTIVDKLDVTDYKILRLLQEDGRISNVELSSKIGLSPGPTLERVKKLEKSGLIASYHAKLNREQFKLGVSVFIQVSLSRQVGDVIERFNSRILEIPNIMECYQITGNADYLLKIVVEDISALERLISGTFSKMEEIGNLRTMLIISEKKHINILPLNYEMEHER
jgi:Lrp/AsnC family leucine-responsive transcriptional regulator